MNQKELADHIRALRKKLGFRQEDVAESMNLSRATYTYKECGTVKFSIEDLLKLEQLFQIDLEELLQPVWHRDSGNVRTTRAATGKRKVGELSSQERTLIARLRMQPEQLPVILKQLEDSKNEAN